MQDMADPKGWAPWFPGYCPAPGKGTGTPGTLLRLVQQLLLQGLNEEASSKDWWYLDKFPGMKQSTRKHM